jgi:hypothetical protein
VNGRKEEQTEYAVLKNCVNRGWQEEGKKFKLHFTSWVSLRVYLCIIVELSYVV